MIRPRGSDKFLAGSQQAQVIARLERWASTTAIWPGTILGRVLTADLSTAGGGAGAIVQQRGTTLPEMLVKTDAQLTRTSTRSAVGQSLFHCASHLGRESVVAKSLEVACDPSVGMALLHMPVPHPPYFYNARHRPKTTGAAHHSPGSAADAARVHRRPSALTDKNRRPVAPLHGTGRVWNTTTVIFSADHPFRHRTT